MEGWFAGLTEGAIAESEILAADAIFSMAVDAGFQDSPALCIESDTIHFSVEEMKIYKKLLEHRRLRNCTHEDKKRRSKKQRRVITTAHADSIAPAGTSNYTTPTPGGFLNREVEVNGGVGVGVGGGSGGRGGVGGSGSVGGSGRVGGRDRAEVEGRGGVGVGGRGQVGGGGGNGGRGRGGGRGVGSGAKTRLMVLKETNAENKKTPICLLQKPHLTVDRSTSLFIAAAIAPRLLSHEWGSRGRGIGRGKPEAEAEMKISSPLNFIKMQDHPKQSQFEVCLQQCILLELIALSTNIADGLCLAHHLYALFECNYSQWHVPCTNSICTS